jgi:hypothetical protein
VVEMSESYSKKDNEFAVELMKKFDQEERVAIYLKSCSGVDEIKRLADEASYSMKLYSDTSAYVKNNKIFYLEEKVKRLKTSRNLLIGALVVLFLSAFLAPVPVKVGDVCLSCWGN